MIAKFVVIGAGSFSFGTLILRDLLGCSDLKGSEIVLVDIDAQRLERMARLATRLDETWEAGFEITATTDRREALPGADIVVGAVEQRRNEMWQLDIEIPRRHIGIDYYGENGGPGGFFHTLRQVPITLDIARDIERLCPDAWFVNMSNPESRLCLALERYTKVKNVGVCLGPYITRRHLATRVLGMPEEEVDVKAVGINHCHWVMDIRHAITGEDLYPELRKRIDSQDPLKPSGAPDPEPVHWRRVEWQPLSRECLRRFRYYPGPGDSHVGEYIGWAHKYFKSKYGDKVVKFFAERAVELEARLDAVARGEGPLDPSQLQEFVEESAFEWQTLDIMLSLLDNGNRYVLSVNIPNRGYVSNLTQDAIVELPAVIAADRIYGLGMGDLPPAIAAMMNLQLTIMDLNVEAAVTGDRQTALEGLMIDPLVPDPATAEKILDDMLVAQADLLPQFR